MLLFSRRRTIRWGRPPIPHATRNVWIISASWLLACLMILSACTVAPVRNRAEIPETLPAQFDACDAVDADEPLVWTESFPSPSLTVDIQTLINENFELKAARARVDQAAIAYGIAGSDRWPSVEAKADVDRARVKEDEPDSTATTRNTIAFEAALTWELDIWGRLKTRQAAAALTLQKKQALADQIALDLQTLLVESWITQHGAKRLKQVLREQRETNLQYLGLTELGFTQGQASVLDVLQQRGNLVSTERSLPDVDARRRRAANAYAVLLGRLPGECDLAEDAWPVIGPLPHLVSPRRLLDLRPDLRAAFLALEAADHEVAAAIADRLPRLSIGLTVAESGSSLRRIGDGNVLRVASGLLVPVFDAGRLKANVAKREAEARESLAVLEQAMRVAVREVEDALAVEMALFDEHGLLLAEIAIARDTVKEATLQYVNGQETFLAVLAALVKQQTLQQNEIALQQELLINRARLLKALGAKWSR